MKDFFHFDHAMVADVGGSYQLVQRFINSGAGDVYLEKVSITISKNSSFIDIVNKIKGLLDEGRVVAYTLSPGHYIIIGKKWKQDVLVLLDNRDRNQDDEDEDEDAEFSEAHNISVSYYSSLAVVADLQATTKDMYQQEKMASIQWWYQTNHGAQTRRVYMPKSKTVLHPEFYPDMVNPEKFIDEYLKSDAAVLMLAGPAGTGKTTLLRHMIASRKLGAHVIFDEDLMKKDSIFHSFLFDKNSDIMIIEDADTILSSREMDGNKMMARFLSVTDGLIKIPNKKVVFTTNLNDFNKVDPALIRPGRCHAKVHLRPLNLVEAQAAAKVAGLVPPTAKGEYTLAELFNQNYRPTLRSVGFGVG